MAKMMIGADIVPTAENIPLFTQPDPKALLGEELLQLLQSAEHCIFNLETPLADKLAPIRKFGPNLIAPTAAAAGYRAMGIDLLTLANNHIMDQGEAGLESTLAALRAQGIDYIGVGNREQAAETKILTLGSKKIGIYACAEHEFSVVQENAPGANPFDPLESPDHIAALRKQCDFVVVLYHGGKEQYRYPSPQLRKTCRKLVEKGAGLVICQHTHCIGCRETYLDGTIVYGQGNFLFARNHNEYWATGLLIELDEDLRVTYHPLQQQGETVRLARDEAAEKILQGFERRNQEILQPGFIESAYEAFARKNLEDYLSFFAGMRQNTLLRAANKLLGRKLIPWLVKRKYKEKTLLAVRNFVECEAHRELLLYGLQHKD